MATISITRDMILTEADMKAIKDSAPTELFITAIAPTVKKTDSQFNKGSEGKFDAYLR